MIQNTMLTASSFTKGHLDNLSDRMSGELEEEEEPVSSKNHGLLQGRLAGFLNYAYDDYNVATELSLDVSDSDRQQILKKYGLKAPRELKPDVAVYYAKDLDFADPEDENDMDLQRVIQMPVCCMEIVSPSQSSYAILHKFRAYFEMGVQSCWFVDPNLKEIRVYTSISRKTTFLEAKEVEDSVLKVKIPLAKIFGKKGQSSQ
jgi:Uma2 family endonuclease